MWSLCNFDGLEVCSNYLKLKLIEFQLVGKNMRASFSIDHVLRQTVLAALENRGHKALGHRA